LNILVIFDGRIFQDSRHTYGYKLCSSCRQLFPLFVRGILHTGVSQEKGNKLPRCFNFTFHYIDDVLSLNNSRFGDLFDRICPIKLEIKDTARYNSYLDLHIEIDSEGRLITKLYDKRDYFNFPIGNFPFICIFQQHLHMEYISLS
jgi:hypothetical protein